MESVRQGKIDGNAGVLLCAGFRNLLMGDQSIGSMDSRVLPLLATNKSNESTFFRPEIMAMNLGQEAPVVSVTSEQPLVSDESKTVSFDVPGLPTVPVENDVPEQTIDIAVPGTEVVASTEDTVLRTEDDPAITDAISEELAGVPNMVAPTVSLQTPQDFEINPEGVTIPKLDADVVEEKTPAVDFIGTIVKIEEFRKEVGDKLSGLKADATALLERYKVLETQTSELCDLASRELAKAKEVSEQNSVDNAAILSAVSTGISSLNQYSQDVSQIAR